MSKKIVLECSHDDFYALHTSVDGARKGSATVKVVKDALAALLRDHCKLIREHRDNLEVIV